MKGRKEEAEVIIRLDQLEGVANICVSSWPGMARKCLKLYGVPLPKSGSQQHYWKIPYRLVSLRRPNTSEKPHRLAGIAPKRRQKQQSESGVIGSVGV